MRGNEEEVGMLGEAAMVSTFVGLTALGMATTLPEGFARVPEDVRAKATVVVVGTYTTGRGPSEPLPDGSRRWPLLRGFTRLVVYRGTVEGDYVGLEQLPAIGPDGEEMTLVVGRPYLLLLRPSKTSLEMLRKGVDNRNYRNALRPDEVVAIVEP